MLGANDTITIARLTSGSQKTYAAPHMTVPAYIEPGGADMLIAQGAPVGQLWMFYTDPLSVPTDVKDSDLVTNSKGKKFIVTGVQEFENHTILTCTSY